MDRPELESCGRYYTEGLVHDFRGGFQENIRRKFSNLQRLLVYGAWGGTVSCLRVLGPHEGRVLVQRLDLDCILCAGVGIV